jgi:hypothetical protein
MALDLYAGYEKGRLMAVVAKPVWVFNAASGYGQSQVPIICATTFERRIASHLYLCIELKVIDFSNLNDFFGFS